MIKNILILNENILNSNKKTNEKIIKMNDHISELDINVWFNEKKINILIFIIKIRKFNKMNHYLYLIFLRILLKN